MRLITLMNKVILKYLDLHMEKEAKRLLTPKPMNNIFSTVFVPLTIAVSRGCLINLYR